ncbi:Psf2-domain-containing protein [Punctularia strigosozonata HHB-11173 SS5]|uniref:Psf2-domain-containing protein n=1 Tax=Punctularia strigosozonata (strain HHB-11173) TaxID=741275 RepID=UPI000441771E|nr:Psf2-domain-containing protein [Punctularia strigosozonata HHB-11173 SS5]EIN10525.1 Psf2-domain-containing protein [Punctularia strigosozonata HHB-11173 SS5]
MSLPLSLRSSVTPPELELIACESQVEVIPLIAMDRTAFVSGAYGPLRPPAKSRVPIWMAINLKLKKKCHIVAPDWLTVGRSCREWQRPVYLQDKLAEETGGDGFSKLPFRYAEIAKVLLDIAPDDIPSPDKVRSLLKDLREARQAKSRAGLQMIDHNELSLPNLSSMEINEIRPFFVRSMGVLTQLVAPRPEATSAE